MSESLFGDFFLKWAISEPEICLVALFGSRVRSVTDICAADENSDWDYQIGTTRPERFADGAWLASMGFPPLKYVERCGRLGSARKVTAILESGEIDLVIFPAADFRALMRWELEGWGAAPPVGRQALTDLSTVLQGGYRVVKGEAEFLGFYRWVVERVRPARLSDEAVCGLADGFVCDFVSTSRKLARGELLAGQRWLHHHLIEVNYQLLHELRLRAGLPSLPDGRRLELLGEARSTAFSGNAELTRSSLQAAVKASAETCRALVQDLVGKRWCWPDLSALHLRAE